MKILEEIVALGISWNSILIRAFITAVCTMGLVQWLKNLFGEHNKKFWAIISLIVCSAIGVLNSTLVPSTVTVITDIVLLSVSLATLGHDALLKGIPELIKAAMNKVTDSAKSGKSAESEGEAK